MTFNEWYEKNKVRSWASMGWLKDDLQSAFRAGMEQGRINERKRTNRRPSGVLNEQRDSHE